MSDRVIVLQPDGSESRLWTLRTIATELSQVRAALEHIEERLERVAAFTEGERELADLGEMVIRYRGTLRSGSRYSLREAIQRVDSLMRTADEPVTQVSRRA